MQRDVQRGAGYSMWMGWKDIGGVNECEMHLNLRVSNFTGNRKRALYSGLYSGIRAHGW